MRYILLSVAVLIFYQGNSQITWQQTKQWRLYKIPATLQFSITADSLEHLKSYQVNSDSIISFLRSAEPLPANSSPTWMGGFVATYMYEGKTRKVMISSYGGFYYDQMSVTFYQLPLQEKDDWMAYINTCLSAP